MRGWITLFLKEVKRFWRVSFQTVAAPVLTACLYMLIFSHVLSQRVEVYEGVTYTAFLMPGLIMISVLQNAFANSSSSLIQSKIMGNLVFILLTPLSHRHFFYAYVLSAMARGLMVGVGVWAATGWFGGWALQAPLWVLVFGAGGAALLACLGVLAGLWADKFDQLAGFQNFCHHAHDVFEWRVLQHSLVARFLAGLKPPQPIFLHDRRLSLRLFCQQRRLALV